jgi:hypothetical protein
MNRQESFKSGTITRGADINPLASISKAWEEMARAHCAGRNEKVALLIAYCLLIRRDQPRLAGQFSAARWQIEREIETDYEPPAEWAQKIQDYALSDEQRTQIIGKFRTTQDAHLLPCEIRLNGRSFEELLNHSYRLKSPGDDLDLHVMTLRGMLGAVDRLPRIFNEADSHAETVNLKKALLAACMIPYSSPSGLSTGVFFQVHQASFKLWLEEADKAFEQAIAVNREWHDKAPAKSYERLYRELKLTVLEHYRQFTQNTAPDKKGLEILVQDFVRNGNQHTRSSPVKRV